jgi:indole-3-glycerol phosphate synthase
MNILTQIIKHKQQEIARQKAKQPLVGFINRLKPSKRDFKKAISNKKGAKLPMGSLAPTRINLIAELKKASPSTGVINKNFDIKKIIKIYNKYASTISVLTDEKFFKGKLEYLAQVKKLSKLPILRKDFIIDEYQIHQTRAAGADAILLIAAILSKEQIDQFIKIAKKYKMDCLVEAHNLAELDKVLRTKAEIIGINNRNLHNFNIDLNTTLDLAKYIPSGKVIVSESGITDYGDLVKLENKVHAVLVGTSLMKSNKLEQTLTKLLFPQVKICGLKTFAAAHAAAKAGADFLGFVFVAGRRRYIAPKKAREIIDKIRKNFPKIKMVGVWQNENLAKVNEIAEFLKLDFIQLHGNESPAYCKRIRKPAIKAISIGNSFSARSLKKYKKNVASFLLDTLDGGRGTIFDWDLVNSLSTKYPIILSGGLNNKNIKQAIKTVRPQVVDVSSGVEDKEGVKNVQKIRRFIKSVKSR